MNQIDTTFSKVGTGRLFRMDGHLYRKVGPKHAMRIGGHHVDDIRGETAVVKILNKKEAADANR